MNFVRGFLIFGFILLISGCDESTKKEVETGGKSKDVTIDIENQSAPTNFSCPEGELSNFELVILEDVNRLAPYSAEETSAYIACLDNFDRALKVEVVETYFSYITRLFDYQSFSKDVIEFYESGKIFTNLNDEYLNIEMLFKLNALEQANTYYLDENKETALNGEKAYDDYISKIAEMTKKLFLKQYDVTKEEDRKDFYSLFGGTVLTSTVVDLPDDYFDKLTASISSYPYLLNPESIIGAVPYTEVRENASPLDDFLTNSDSTETNEQLNSFMSQIENSEVLYDYYNNYRDDYVNAIETIDLLILRNILNRDQKFLMSMKNLY